MELNLIDMAAEAKSVGPAKTMEMSHPVVTKKIYGSKRKLYPFTSEELDGYRLPGSDRTGVRIACGNITSICPEQMTIMNNDEEATFRIHNGKLAPGMKVTAAILDDDCLKLKLGPFFGVMTWNLFYGDNKKSATSFIVR